MLVVWLGPTFNNERCGVGPRDSVCLFPGLIPTSPVRRLQETAQAGDHSNIIGLVSLLPDCIHTASGCQYGKKCAGLPA